jgi:hypothetical protein
MTVTVTLRDGGADKYMRFGDAYVKHNDGTLDVRGLDRRGRRRKELEEGPFLGLIDRDESGHGHRFAFHHLGRGSLTGAHSSIDKPVHDG